MMTQYVMRGAFDVSDAIDLAETTDIDEAVRFTWGELLNDMRDELDCNRDHVNLVRYHLNGDDVDIYFEAPYDRVHEDLHGVERL